MPRRFKTYRYRNSMALVPLHLGKGEYSKLAQQYANEGKLLDLAFMRWKFIVEPHKISGDSISAISRRLGVSRRIIHQCLAQFDPTRRILSLMPGTKGRTSKFTKDFAVELKKLRRGKAESLQSYRAIVKTSGFKSLLKKHGLDGLSRSRFYKLVSKN